MEFDLGLKLKKEEIKILLELIDNQNLTTNNNFLNKNRKYLKSLQEKNLLQINNGKIEIVDFKKYLKQKIKLNFNNKSDLTDLKENEIIENSQFNNLNNVDIDPIKSYLIKAQKQISKIDTDIKSAILVLRKMIDNLIDQIKNQIDNIFLMTVDYNSETGEWVSIPHVSPIGFYEPIYELNNKFSELFDDLHEKMDSLTDNYSSMTIVELKQVNLNDLNLIKLSNKINQEKNIIKEEMATFITKIKDSISFQIKSLETNLGKDLIEQFDAIERLNDLNPERIHILLNKAHSDLIKSINGFYSRIIREVNSVQKQADFSSLSLILTNEAGKMLKTIGNRS